MLTKDENEFVLKEGSSNGINGDKDSKESKDSKEKMVLDENNEKEDKENNENETKEDKENNEVNTEQILSDTRVDITFSQMNESIMSRESVKTYQSIPFTENKLDLDLPYFSPTKFESVYWKIFHSLSFFLFAAILSTSTWFFYKKQRQIYHISLTIANVFFIISTIMEWNHFKRGCIGYSNLNSKVKRNIDKSFRAKVLRSEFGLKYFISFMASIMFIFGNIYYFFFNGLEIKITTNVNNIDNPFLDYNLFGMLTLSLSEIMKLEKMLIENKTNSVKSDFSKSLVEILLFFGSLLFGASYMIQLFYLNVDESPLDKFYIIIRAIGNLNFLISSLILQYRYYLDNYNDLNVNEDYSDF
jgi:hypothetical protein